MVDDPLKAFSTLDHEKNKLSLEELLVLNYKVLEFLNLSSNLYEKSFVLEEHVQSAGTDQVKLLLDEYDWDVDMVGLDEELDGLINLIVLSWNEVNWLVLEEIVTLLIKVRHGDTDLAQVRESLGRIWQLVEVALLDVDSSLKVSDDLLLVTDILISHFVNFIVSNWSLVLIWVILFVLNFLKSLEKFLSLLNSKLEKSLSLFLSVFSSVGFLEFLSLLDDLSLGSDSLSFLLSSLDPSQSFDFFLLLDSKKSNFLNFHVFKLLDSDSLHLVFLKLKSIKSISLVLLQLFLSSNGSILISLCLDFGKSLLLSIHVSVHFHSHHFHEFSSLLFSFSLFPSSLSLLISKSLSLNSVLFLSSSSPSCSLSIILLDLGKSSVLSLLMSDSLESQLFLLLLSKLQKSDSLGLVICILKLRVSLSISLILQIVLILVLELSQLLVLEVLVVINNSSDHFHVWNTLRIFDLGELL